MVHLARSIDAEVGGASVRLIVDGFPSPPAIYRSATRVRQDPHAELLRRHLILPPRGHDDLCGVVLTEPVSSAAVAGLLFLDARGFPQLLGTAVIAAVTIALERRLLHAADRRRLAFDTAAGVIHAEPRVRQHADQLRVDSVAVESVPAFVVRGGHLLKAGSRDVRVDVVSAGRTYAVVDTEAVGAVLDVDELAELRRLAIQIARGAAPLRHPGDGSELTIDAVVFTAPPRDPEAHLRQVAISRDGAVNRSPSVTGTIAVMTVLEAMGLIIDAQPFVAEGITGAIHRARIVSRTEVAGVPALVPEVEASATITGDHTFYFEEVDGRQ
jgi:proline racemase